MEQFFIVFKTTSNDSVASHCERTLRLSRLTELTPVDEPALLWCEASGLSVKDLIVWLSKSLVSGYWPIVLSSAPSDEEAMACIQSGARGYCHSLASLAQLEQVASVVSQGGYWLGESNVARMIDQWLLQSRPSMSRPKAIVESALYDALTVKEQAVARQIACGACNKEIAQRLGISERSVKAHLTSIFDKLSVRDRVQLALKLNGIASA